MTDLTTRAQLEAVARGYNEVMALQAKQRVMMADMLHVCILRVESPDSRKRREGIDGLKQLQALLEQTR